MRDLNEILSNKHIWGHNIMFQMHTAWIKLPDCGTCSVIWSENEDGMEHVSISPKKKLRIPTWDDMCVLKETFFRDSEEAYEIHPKKSEYVNMVENCLHLWKPIGQELGDLIAINGEMKAILMKLAKVEQENDEMRKELYQPELPEAENKEKMKITLMDGRSAYACEVEP